MPTLSPSTCARFQLTAARRRLVGTFAPGDNGELFQLTAARRRLAFWDKLNQMLQKFQLTAARRRLVRRCCSFPAPSAVSTHSRPKAAGRHKLHPLLTFLVSTHSRPKAAGDACVVLKRNQVSTHSRPKAAGPCPMRPRKPKSFQLTAARRRLGHPPNAAVVQR